MKKCFCVLLCILTAFTASFSASYGVLAAQSSDIERTQLGTSDTYYEYNASTKTLTISGEGAMPDMKNSEANQPWYAWRSNSVDNVVICEGITDIGNYCFYSVKASSFTIPSTLRTIRRYAFASTLIDDVSLPFGVTSVGAYAFDECTNLQSVTLHDTVKTIGDYAFHFCSSLEQMTIPYSVTSIGLHAFDLCSSLSSLAFEDMTSSVKLSSYAFYDCAALTNISFPANATLGKSVFGVGRNGKISGAVMGVYDSSSAHIYAESNGVSFTVLDDAFPLYCGVTNSVSYNSENLGRVYNFAFTPDFSGVYNFYSSGETDVKGVLLDGASVVAQNDDWTAGDRNFCVTANLTSGREYVLQVSSMHSEGEADIVVYPDVITSFDIEGSLSYNAADGFRSSAVAYFPIVDSALSDFVLDIHFENGYSDKIYYRAGYFDNKQISILDTQDTHTFTCGVNTEIIAIGGVTGEFPVYVSHSYVESYVPYTLDDDGYTLNTCILCGDSYKSDFVPTPARTVRGRCVLMTHPDGSLNADIPLSNVTVEYGGNTYYTDSDGRFSFRTFDNGTLTLTSPYCEPQTIEIELDSGELDLEEIPLPAYDFNGDGHINGRDLAVFKTTLANELGRDYFKNAVNFM